MNAQENQQIVLNHKFKKQYRALRQKDECNWVESGGQIIVSGDQEVVLSIDSIKIDGQYLAIKDINSMHWMDDLIRDSNHPMTKDREYKAENYDTIIIHANNGRIKLSGMKQGVFPLLSYLRWFI